MLGIGLGLMSAAMRTTNAANAEPLPSLDLNFTSGTLDPRIVVTRVGTATRINASGLIETVAANTARIDHNPITLARRGLLIEESRTNMALWSEDYATRVEWTKQNSTVTANATTAPDGSANGHKLVENTASTNHLLRQNFTLTAATTYTASIFAKAAERSVFTLLCFDQGSSLPRGSHFNLATGVVTQGSTSLAGSAGVMTALPNGWYRCSVTFTTTTGGANGYFDCRMSDTATPPGTGQAYTGNGTSGMFFFGGQLEAGAFPTSYIPTTSAVVARAVDQATLAVGSWYSASTGTLFADFTPIAVGGSGVLQTAIYLDDGTANERMGIRASGTANAALVVDNNAVQAQMTIGTLSASATRVALAYALNDFAGVQNGGTVQIDATGTVPTPTRLLIGSRLTGNEPINAHFRRVRFWQTRRSNADLQTLTAS